MEIGSDFKKFYSFTSRLFQGHAVKPPLVLNLCNEIPISNKKLMNVMHFHKSCIRNGDQSYSFNQDW